MAMVTQKQIREAIRPWKHLGEQKLRYYIYALLEALTTEQLKRIIENPDTPPGVRYQAHLVLNKRMMDNG